MRLLAFPWQREATAAARIGGRSRDRAKLVFVLPAVLWVILLTILPLFYAVWVSLHSFRRGKMVGFVGLDNFARLLDDATAWESLRLTALFVVVVVSIEMVLGFALALLFSREVRGRGVLRTLMTTPLFATPVAMGYVATTIFYEIDGPVNALIQWLGGAPIPWISSPQWARVAIVIVDVWQWTPFVFLIALAGLLGLPADLLEAARVDGSTPWQVFRHVMLPLLAPLLWLIVLLRAIDAFKIFDIVISLTGGGPGRATEVYNLYVFRTARQFFNYGEASAQAFLLLLVVMVFVSLLWGRIRALYEQS